MLFIYLNRKGEHSAVLMTTWKGHTRVIVVAFHSSYFWFEVLLVGA